MEEKEEILNKANYCLGCKVKPCSLKGCPMQTNIPEFIGEMKTENYEEAYKILQENNVFSYICSIVCPQEEQCEGSCIRGIKSYPTSIGKLEKFVNEYAIENGLKYEAQVKESNGKKVAIIGSGPAGLECAYELLKEGYAVDIYEKDSIPGGIMIYGIPDFRLSKDKVNAITDKIKDMGANYILNTTFGQDIKLEDLTSKYDAVFMGIGAYKSTVYSLSEDNIKGVYKSDDFLKAYASKDFIKDLGVVSVIGGGNVAMDCSRAAVKMGASKVKILYRRDRECMPAREVELDEAIEDGVEFKELTRVVDANHENGKILSVNCQRTKIENGKAVDDEEVMPFTEETNTVVFAIGLKPEKNVIEEAGIALDDWGYIKIDENGRTSIKNVYAGGDVTESKATVCRAIASGKRAALGIINDIK